jgi:molecular chaperone DnaK
MKKDAEMHAEEDRKFHELVETRNQADALIHATRKSLDELGEKVDGAERANIESLMKELEEAMKGDNKDVIETKSKALAEASGKLAEKMYQGQENGGAQPGGAAPGGEQAAASDEDVVDAEFEEVDDDKK